MADLKPTFPILENVSTQAGEVWHKVAEGDAAASKNAGAVLVAKDDSNNLIYLRTDSAGKLIVTTEDTDISGLYDEGENAGSTSFVDLASITLQASYKYSNIAWIASCFREAILQIVWLNDTVETIIGTIRVGPGDFTSEGLLPDVEFESGATGTQTLKIKGKNLYIASTMNASLSTKEDQTP